jgi:hypothetical protein
MLSGAKVSKNASHVANFSMIAVITAIYFPTIIPNPMAVGLINLAHHRKYVEMQ